MQDQDNIEGTTHNRNKKRKQSDTTISDSVHELENSSKKCREDPPSPGEMNNSQKRANFSALTTPTNGFNKHTSPLANNGKPPSAKKLVIKNFKGTLSQYQNMLCSF